jgi:hypothetical protein
MVAALSPLLSAQPPAVPQRAGLGDRFHYFRGTSGRRYLFSAVAVTELADFCSAVVMMARRSPDGRLSAQWLTVLDPFGRPVGSPRHWPPVTAPDTVTLVHLLSATEAERFALVDDLAPPVAPPVATTALAA